MSPVAEVCSSHSTLRSSNSTLEIPTSPSQVRWVVEVQDDAGARRTPLPDRSFLVGASPASDLMVHDPTVSASHCSLTASGGFVAIADLGSKNGTYVGGARVREAWGQEGTLVVLGRSTLTLISSSASPSSADAAGTEPPPGAPLPGVAGGSIAMRRLADQVRRLAKHALPVLIAGESGTGKELVARSLHCLGPRRARPFVAINVTALPRELVETELFGHERGAFTGAHARGGSLFLDEIGDLPLEAQPKLLRALDGYEVRRVGAAGSGQRADVRVIAATHAQLDQRVTSGEFRRDLFHRLECFVLTVPALRDRRGDIPAIARELLGQLAPDVGSRVLTPSGLARLAAHTWPGNVRELRNVLCRAGDCARTPRIEAADVDRAIRRDSPAIAKCLTPHRARELLRENTGNLSAAARAAGMPRTSFRKLLSA
jgi:DNA-binding NtrC family response regulator